MVLDSIQNRALTAQDRAKEILSLPVLDLARRLRTVTAADAPVLEAALAELERTRNDTSNDLRGMNARLNNLTETRRRLRRKATGGIERKLRERIERVVMRLSTESRPVRATVRVTFAENAVRELYKVEVRFWSRDDTKVIVDHCDLTWLLNPDEVQDPGALRHRLDKYRDIAEAALKAALS